jgi:hypothetical protein
VPLVLEARDASRIAATYVTLAEKARKVAR